MNSTLPYKNESNNASLLAAWQRWLYGGLGSTAPIAAAGATADFVAIFSDLQPIVFVGWFARTVVLFVIGGFVSFMHRHETSEWRAFVIGISAPALLTTLLAGNQVTAAQKRAAPITEVTSVGSLNTFAFFKEVGKSRLLLHTSSTSLNVAKLCVPPEKWGQQFLRGVLGSPRDFSDQGVWIISPLQSTNYGGAVSLVKSLQQDRYLSSLPQFNPEILLTPDGRYLVAVARKLDASEAHSIISGLTGPAPVIAAPFSTVVRVTTYSGKELPGCQ